MSHELQDVGGAQVAAQGPSSDERILAGVAHLTGLLALSMPVVGLLAPLGVWIAKRDTSPWVAEHAKESLNFNIAVTVYFWIFVVLSFALIGIPLLVGLGMAWLVLTIVAAVRAYDGTSYRYPLIFRIF